MLLLAAIINANKEWLTRAGVRWGNAATSINAGTYEGKQLFKDLLESWVNDPLQWVTDVARETQTTGLIINAKGLTTQKSGFIPVANPSKTKITSLTRLGGSEQMVVGTHVSLDTPPVTTAGTVVVKLDNLQTAGPAAHPPGEYLGFLVEDNLPLSYIVALR